MDLDIVPVVVVESELLWESSRVRSERERIKKASLKWCCLR
jgi:hypothetical protein